MSEKDKKKIVEAIESVNFEEALKEEGFTIYTTESKSNKKKKDVI